MSVEQLVLIAFNVLLGLVATFFGLWVRGLQATVSDQAVKLEKLNDKFSDYVLREDLHRDMGALGGKLDKIDEKIDKFVQRIDDRLDKKADKT